MLFDCSEIVGLLHLIRKLRSLRAYICILKNSYVILRTNYQDYSRGVENSGIIQSNISDVNPGLLLFGLDNISEFCHD